MYLNSIFIFSYIKNNREHKTKQTNDDLICSRKRKGSLGEREIPGHSDVSNDQIKCGVGGAVHLCHAYFECLESSRNYRKSI